MQRRDFLAATAAGIGSGLLSKAASARGLGDDAARECCGPTYASPADAMRSPPEQLVYVAALYTGTSVNKPDYLATVDVDPHSKSYSQVIDRLPMPEVGDELHHFGWNACSSCHADPARRRRYLIVPGFKSGRIHIIDVADRRSPKLHKVIEPADIVRRTNLSAPHTVHCLPSGEIMISMLGDGQGNAPGGFLLLDDEFKIVGRWESGLGDMRFNYDFWYQPRRNIMVSSEWAAPNTFRKGFDLKDVEAGKYGQRIHFWDWKNRKILQSLDLDKRGLIPLEVRFHHNPESEHGFVGATLSSTIWHWHRAVRGEGWQAEPVIEVKGEPLASWPMPVPGLITDILVSMDDRYLYFSNWLHGDIRQYDIGDPSKPKLTGQVWCGGLLGKPPGLKGRTLDGGPQMLQLSLDGKRLYVTNSLYSSWDNQFYPKLAGGGGYMLQVDCDTTSGGLKINDRFYVDFGREPRGPARAHEMHFPGGDCSSDIWI